MSATTAVRPNQRRAIDRLPVAEQRRVRAEQARQFEVKQKSFIQRAALKVASFFKRAAKAVVSAPKRAIAAINRTTGHEKFSPVRVAVEAVQYAWLFVRRYWGELLAGALFSAAFIVAPIPTLFAAACVAASYRLARSESRFARFAAHVLFRTGVELFADGLVTAAYARKR